MLRGIRFGSCEIFFVPIEAQTKETCFWNTDDNGPMGSGWFYWCCSVGCLPEGDPIGPFKTRAEAYMSACDNGYIDEESEDSQ